MEAGTLEVVEVEQEEEEHSDLVCQAKIHLKTLAVQFMGTEFEVPMPFECTIKAVGILGRRCADSNTVFICQAFMDLIHDQINGMPNVCAYCNRPLTQCWYVTQI